MRNAGSTWRLERRKTFFPKKSNKYLNVGIFSENVYIFSRCDRFSVQRLTTMITYTHVSFTYIIAYIINACSLYDFQTI